MEIISHKLPRPQELQKVLLKLHKEGGQPMIVGGAVRDWLLSIEPKDLDIEVYNLREEKMLDILSSHGKVDLVGKSFGIIKLTIDKETYDFSLPRADSKHGDGHKGFKIQTDPFMHPKEASKRRDFTINSLFYDPINEKLEDPHNGIPDLKSKILRHTSAAFSEDPLRALRAVQFSARFDFSIDDRTAKLCKNIIENKEHENLAKERVQEEINKFLLKGKHHLQGFDTWNKIGWLDHFPELAAIRGLRQDHQWHPEGDVLTHTAYCLSALQDIKAFQELPESEKLVYALGTLCHDLGKPYTSYEEYRESLGRNVITSPDHPRAGLKPTQRLLTNLGYPQEVIERAKLLTLYHMEHLWVKTPKDVQILAAKLSPHNPHSDNPKISETILGLSIVTEADHSGRPPLEKKQPEQMTKILNIAQELGCLNKPIAPLIKGEDLLERGVTPSKTLGKIIKEAYGRQLESKFKTKQDAIKWLDRNFRTICPNCGGPTPLINGTDLEQLGIKKGKVYSKLLSESYIKQLKNEISSKEEAITIIRKEAKKQPLHLDINQLI